MLIKTERTTIRLITEDDWHSIKDIWVDFARSEYALFDRPSCTDDDAVQSRIAKWAAANRAGTDHLFFAVCVGERVIGYCAFNRRPESYELGYCFDSAYHGKGFAKESISALLLHLQKMGIDTFTAGTALENIPSVALLQSLGFRQTGTEQVSFYKDENGNDIVFEGGLFEKRG